VLLNPPAMTMHRKKLLRFGAALNVCGAIGLLALGAVDGVVPLLVLGVVEALFSVVALWIYRHTPVRPK